MTQTNSNADAKVSQSVMVDASSALPGLLWLGGWMFTIGYAKLGFWSGFTGLFVWPYFLGVMFAPA